MKHALAALLCAATLLALSTSEGFAEQLAEPLAGSFASDYQLRLQPDFASQRLAGSERILLQRGGPGWPARLRWPLNGLVVEELAIEGKVLPVTVQDGALLIELAPALARLPELHIRLRYTGRPRQGLTFGPDHVYSAYDSCHWMVCASASPAPAPKASFAIELLLPAGYRSVAGGASQGEQALGGLVLQRWRQPRPEPVYSFGFAAGRFHEASEIAQGKTLHYLGVQDDAATLRRKFAPTAAMLAFFSDKAGLSLPDARYTQVLLPGAAAQEASSLSLIGKKMLDPIDADPGEDWVIAHELAHQWWGNWLTCKSWQHFWLNEGITVFMTAAWKQQRWGEAAYQEELALARRRWRIAIDAGFDQPLAWGGDYPSLAIRRAIQYSKGALFMDALRQQLGEAVFWDGLRRYTRAHAGGLVESVDLQEAMEAAAGRDLAPMFKAWVGG